MSFSNDQEWNLSQNIPSKTYTKKTTKTMAKNNEKLLVRTHHSQEDTFRLTTVSQRSSWEWRGGVCWRVQPFDLWGKREEMEEEGGREGGRESERK